MTRGLMNSLACIETSCGRAMIPSRRSGASRSATAGSCSMTAGTAARQRVAAEHPGRGWDELAGDVVCAKGRDPVGLAFELAVSCSATGARPLTRNERFTASKRLSEIHPEWSLREVASGPAPPTRRFSDRAARLGCRELVRMDRSPHRVTMRPLRG